MKNIREKMYSPFRKHEVSGRGAWACSRVSSAQLGLRGELRLGLGRALGLQLGRDGGGGIPGRHGAPRLLDLPDRVGVENLQYNHQVVDFEDFSSQDHTIYIHIQTYCTYRTSITVLSVYTSDQFTTTFIQGECFYLRANENVLKNHFHFFEEEGCKLKRYVFCNFCTLKVSKYHEGTHKTIIR